MCSATVLDQSLKMLLDQEEPSQCRFCNCTEFSPCGIAIAQDPDGTIRLARLDAEVIEVLPCSWYIDRVCNSPACIERLIAERRSVVPAHQHVFNRQGCCLLCDLPQECLSSRVLLFDGQGRAIPLGGRTLDLTADDRDFAVIGRELGLRPEEISREAIVERIRELRKAAA